MKAHLAGACLFVMLAGGCSSTETAIPAPPAYTPDVRPEDKPAMVTLRADDRVGWDVRLYRASHPLDPRCLRQPYSTDLALGNGESQAAMFLDVDQVKPTEKRLKSLGHAVLLARRTLPPASVAEEETSMTEEWIDVSWVQPGLIKGQPPCVRIASRIEKGAVAFEYAWVAGVHVKRTSEQCGEMAYGARKVSGLVFGSRFDRGPGGWWYIAVAEPVIVHEKRSESKRKASAPQ